MTPLEQRQAEDAEREAKLAIELKRIAAEMVLIHFGITDWQRFRSKNQLEYLRAKIEVVSAPPKFELYVDHSTECTGFTFTFVLGGTPAFRRPVQQPQELRDRYFYRTEDVPEVPRRFFVLHSPQHALAREPDELLGIILRDAERYITRESGIETRFSVRTDKAAYEHSQKETRK